ncbi:MAG TPA: GYD domain-containing protein [Ktedonobacterales bacterium]|nr:GYD domain-containing protein [Ktedonobacterales bacterium]
MAHYIVLGKFTEQGIKEIRNLPQFVEENIRRGEQMGLKVHGWYLTMGQYDIAIVVEGPDDATMSAQAIGVASRGLSRMETLRAFTLDEAKQIIQRLG